jgi:tetratricopeptide (TPR) repeat protein
MALDDFLKAAWRDHGDDPQAVADRLQTSTHLIGSAQDFAPYARLVTHVFGEHLLQESHGLALLATMQTLPAFDGSAVAAASLLRNVATLRYVQGDTQALTGLSDEDRVCALAAASVMVMGRNDFELAVQSMDQALAGAKRDWPAQSSANRALAIAGNNLAAVLEDKADRTAQQTLAMLAAAQTGLAYWKLAGTWLEEERAEYRLARCLLQAGDTAKAVQSAQRCLAVCQGNDAPAFELFFAHAVLALACRAAGDVTEFADHRDAALRSYRQVPEDEQAWCSRELGELG